MMDLRQHFFSDRIVNKWNTLSEDIGLVSALRNYSPQTKSTVDCVGELGARAPTP